uniref:Uncharacterized protein n=1 Tax=Physcomitrium patens TaxID=3218 RepID=A0A2K1JIB1_PHYPA|nr:hypothetical protein PHYPA_018691 [Physcomitrium patens]
MEECVFQSTNVRDGLLERLVYGGSGTPFPFLSSPLSPLHCLPTSSSPIHEPLRLQLAAF